MAGHFKRAAVTLAVLLAFIVLPWAPEAKSAFSGAEPGSSASASAENNAPASAVKTYTGERISLDFQNAEVQSILKIIGEVSGKSIVVSDAVHGKVTLKLRDVPWDQALDIILTSKNLEVEEAGNVLTVYDQATWQKLRADREKNEQTLRDNNQYVQSIKQVFTPKYAPIEAVNVELAKLKSEHGKIVVLGNDIYVEDEPGVIAAMNQVFMRVDRAGSQILIEIQIVESSATFAQKFGFQIYDGHSNDGKIPTTDGTIQKTPKETAGVPDFTKNAKLKAGSLNKTETLLLNAEILAAANANEARTLSAPRIIAANGQKVFVKQGQLYEQPTASSKPTAAKAQLPDPLENVEMVVAVTPHSEENGKIITLDLELATEISSSPGNIAEESTFYPRKAQTTLMLNEGEAIVVGGIITDSSVSGADPIMEPNVTPLKAWLFQNRQVAGQKSELLIFITAQIIPVNI